MKKNTVLVLVLFLMMTSLSETASAEQLDFSDTEKHWSSDWIGLLMNEGITSGYPDGTFRPDKHITIEEFITFTIKVLQSVNKEKYRITEHGDSWSDGYISKAIEHNIIKHNEFDNYRRVIKREEMASIIINAYSRENIIPQSNLTKELALVIKDYHDISDYYVDSVLTAWKEGFISGKGDNVFDPKGTATRGEASVLLVKLKHEDKRTSYFKDRPSTTVYYSDWDGAKAIETPMTFYAPTNKEGKIVTEVLGIYDYLEANDRQEHPYFETNYNPHTDLIYTVFWKDSNFENLDVWEKAGHMEMTFKIDMKDLERGIMPYTLSIWKHADSYENFSHYSIYFQKKYGVYISKIFTCFFDADTEEALEVFYEVLDRNDNITRKQLELTFNGRRFSINGSTGLSLYFSEKAE